MPRCYVRKVRNSQARTGLGLYLLSGGEKGRYRPFPRWPRAIGHSSSPFARRPANPGTVWKEESESFPTVPGWVCLWVGRRPTGREWLRSEVEAFPSLKGRS